MNVNLLNLQRKATHKGVDKKNIVTVIVTVMINDNVNGLYCFNLACVKTMGLQS